MKTIPGRYRRRALVRSSWMQWGFVGLAIMSASAPAAGQTAAPLEQPLLGSTLSTDLLQELPTSNSVFAALETIMPELVSDRFFSGGLNAATAPRLGAFLNSWTQTQFRIGDINVTDPRSGGTPLLLPILPLWERVTAATGGMGIDDGASGLSIALEPRRPGTKWIRTVEGSLTGPFLVSRESRPVPVVDRVRQWQDGYALASGPLTDRVGLVAAGSWRGLSHVPAGHGSATDDRVASGFAHLVFSATPRDEIRALGWVQRVTTAAFADTALHVQSTWNRRDAGQGTWRVFGGYTERNMTAPATSAHVVDSVTSGPVSDFSDPGLGSTRRWAFGARMTSSATRALPTVGVDLEGAHVRVEPTGLAEIRELVGGTPARVWTLHAGAGPDVRHLTTLAAHANEHVAFGRLTLDAGLRLDAVTGAAGTAGRGIGWTTWLPRSSLRWQITHAGDFALVASYRRSAHQLPLSVLAIGDPAAPVADVSAWNGTSIGPLIARVGPGTGGDNTLTQIDPRLKRPVTDELMLTVELRPISSLRLKAAGMAKREKPLLGLVDVGVPSSAYTAVSVPDPSGPPWTPATSGEVTAYSRPPNSYGEDRYLLTNQPGDPATFFGLETSIRVSTSRFVLIADGALWTEALGPAAAAGSLPTQNDQDVLGSLLTDPNAATHARGQLFQDRTRTLKIAGVYRFPWRVRLGAIARYQDGQPFARLVVAPDLTQGPTAVRAYRNGGTAFTYTGTLDIRVEKIFTRGRSEIAAVANVYNLPNLSNEVTENIVAGPMFRAPTALQPPRTASVGVRVMF